MFAGAHQYIPIPRIALPVSVDPATQPSAAKTRTAIRLTPMDDLRVWPSQEQTKSTAFALPSGAQDAIAADPTKSWSLSALARVVGANERHISRLFREHVGMSILEYSNRLRVAYAQELLRETRIDMERVAEQSGFSSTRHLRRAWRRVHNSPPREARLVVPRKKRERATSTSRDST